MVIIGSDHAGYELKEKIKQFLEKKGITVTDLGTHSSEACDYPDIARAVAENVTLQNEMGILACGTGIGMAMAANKVKGVRAASCHSVETAGLSREHNNANILCIGWRFTSENSALKMVDTFLNTPFSKEERHKNRVAKIE
jgi:ribose 5-phosphate isomerase B